MGDLDFAAFGLGSLFGEGDSEQEEVTPAASGKKRVLIVDDNAIHLRSMRSQLSDYYDVNVASSGEAAIAIVDKWQPDVVLLDYEMPGISGRDVLAVYKSKDNMKDVPVIFVTGVNDKEYIMQVLALKPAGYILKPPDLIKLQTILEEVLGE